LKRHLGVPLCLFGAAFAYVLVLTGEGALLVPDSASYLGAAHNLLIGRGLTTPAQPDTSTLHVAEALRQWGRQPYAEFGPLYPTLLAGLALVGFPLHTGVRVINSGSIGLLALAGYLIAGRLQKSSRVLPIGVGLFLIFAPTRPEGPFYPLNPVRLSTLALSEPLTYGLAAISLFLYLRFLQEGSDRTLSMSLLCAGLASAARFQLLSLVLAEICMTVVVSRKPAWLVRAIVCGAGPLLAFEVVDVLVFHEHAGETFRHHGSSHVLSQLLGWLFGGLFGTARSTALAAATLAFCAVALTVGRLITRRGPFDRTERLWLALLGFYVCAQIGFLWVTRTWLNAYLAIDQRILGPAQLGLDLILVTVVCASVAAVARMRIGPARFPRIYPLVSTAAAAALLVGGVANTVGRITLATVPPEMPAAVRAAPGPLVLSNDPPVVYLATGHAVVLAPVSVFLTTAMTNPELGGDLSTMVTALLACGGKWSCCPRGPTSPRPSCWELSAGTGRSGTSATG
jgi:hypothetical protein